MTTLPFVAAPADAAPLSLVPIVSADAGGAAVPAGDGNLLPGFDGVLELCSDPAPTCEPAATPAGPAFFPADAPVTSPVALAPPPLRFNPQSQPDVAPEQAGENLMPGRPAPSASAAPSAPLTELAPDAVSSTSVPADKPEIRERVAGVQMPAKMIRARATAPTDSSPSVPADAEALADTVTTTSARALRVKVPTDANPDDWTSADAPDVVAPATARDVPDEVRALAVGTIPPPAPAERPRAEFVSAARSGAPRPETPAADGGAVTAAPQPVIAPVANATVNTESAPFLSGVPGGGDRAKQAEREQPAAVALAEPLVSSTEITPKMRTRSTLSASTEKIAARLATALSPAEGLPSSPVNNRFLNPDKQLDAEPLPERGTENAKLLVDMKATSEFSPRFSAESTAGVERTVSSTVMPVHATTPSGAALETDSKSAPEISMHALDAASVVRDVVELTHEFRMRDRSSVEVKFNFKDATELTVRLAYRNGDVHTTFRTDSAELRTALGAEWNAYAASAAQGARDYKIADPVFTTSGDFSHASQNRDHGSSPRDEAPAQSNFSQSDHSGNSRTAHRQAGVFRSSQSAASASPAPAEGVVRISSDRLLHAFA